MSIIVRDTERTITLNTIHTTYQIRFTELGHVLHLYYGERIEPDDLG